MCRRISFLVVAAVALFALPSGAWANPVACERLVATRSGPDVLLTLELDKVCYAEPPDATAISTFIGRRDMFEIPLAFTDAETALYYTLSATDLGVSDNKHSYEITFEGAEPGRPYLAATEVDGTQCTLLEGTLDGGQADLTLRLVRDCFATPLPALEYRVRRNLVPTELDWSEVEGPDTVTCTAVDDAVGTAAAHYELGVRGGGDSCHAVLILYEEAPSVDAGVSDAAVGADGGHDFDGDGVGCASGGRSGGLWLLWVGVLLGLWRRRRP